jgi:thiol:disulfide interchange protein DsbC
MRLRLVGLMVAAAVVAQPLFSTVAQAQSAQPVSAAEPAVAKATNNGNAAVEGQVKKAFEKRFPGIGVEAVNTTPFPDLYEVQIGMDLLYTNAKVDYILQGSLIDAKARTDLTAERMEKLSAVDFASLPLDLAVKQVKGDGSRMMAVFEDPNCVYCKRLHQSLRELDNTTVYTFLFPILSPDSETKARDVWCAKDPAKAWSDWMLNGKTPAEAQCDTPVETVLELGRKLMVQGTPAIFFADGSRVNGALPLEDLKAKLDTLN